MQLSDAEFSVADRQAIIDQLERLLASPLFSGSKRLCGFLRHIVEQTLENGGSDLRERLIGVRAFGRRDGYDTAADPVVRVSAGDLRKRLAQYYYEPGHESEPRIELPTGSYRPLFQLHPHVHAPAVSVDEPHGQPLIHSAPEPQTDLKAIVSALVHSVRWNSRTFALSAAVIVAALLGSVAAVEATRAPLSAYEQFWEPVTSGKGPALVYAGTREDGHLTYEDAIALAYLSGDLRTRNMPYRTLKASELSSDTLKQGPSVLIGGLTNSISRRVTLQLRYTFAIEGVLDGDGLAYIQDRRKPESKIWSVRLNPLSDAPTYTDYAIVSRVIDPITGRMAVVSAGIRRYGNLAAAEFLSRAEQLEALTSVAPPDWRRKNMQAVLAVDVKHGVASPARVEAAYFW